MRTYLFFSFTAALVMAQAGARARPGPAGPISSPRPNVHAGSPVRPFRLPPRTGVETQMGVTLDQTLTMALANNKDIESSRIDRLESDYMLTGAQGTYDPQLNVTSYWEQQTTPIASALADRPREAC